jgi:hypothetical protein
MCGQLIHPIAGRCKHCKGDLRAMRSTRPAAIASLPSLLANAQGEPTYTQGNRNGHVNGARGQMNGHAHGGGGASGYAPMPHTAAVVPKAIIDDGSQPILPPRPTGRMMTAAREGGWFSRNWPLLVIATACVAILVALVLMVVPHLLTKDKDAGVKGNKLTPAPERMDTDPLVPKDPRGSTDPWKNGDPKPDIDIPDDPDVKDPDDPPAGGAATLQGSGAIMMGMVRHACDRAQTCGKLDDERLKEYCEETKKWPVAPPPASCPSAQRCFNHIDQMSCSAGFDDISALTAVMHKFEDCVEAISCS